MTHNIPLIIIGAGPAGLSTALHLLQQDPGWKDRMILLERASHPRHKLCGGGVTQFGLQHLEALDVPVPLPIPHAVVRDARFVYKNRVVHVYGSPEIVVFHRQELDHFLADTARQRGLVIHENERVLGLEQTPDGVVVTTERETYLAQAVVGADGSRGVTRNSLSRSGGPTRTARLLEGVHAAAEKAPQFSQEYALFDFTPTGDDLQGYVWDFPARVNGLAHHNRGIYDARVARSRPKAGLPRLMDRALASMGSDPSAVKKEGHPIHWFSPRTVMSGERLVLVGDAAGAEPLFGEGIAPALGYGKVAARALQTAFEARDFSFKNYKRRVLFSRLGAYLLLRWYIAWWSYRLSDREWFMHVMWTIGSGLAAFTRGSNGKTPDSPDK